MRLTKYILSGALIFLLSSFSACSIEALERFDTSIFNAPQRPGAVFDHDDHNQNAELEEDCSICHHVYENKKKIEDESSEDSSCSDCHLLKAYDENTVPLRMAFHQQCRTCHVKSKKGPLLCGQCHVRK